MKIIIDKSQEIILNHALKALSAIEKYEQSNAHTIKPKGIQHHRAKHPISCDDCGETYWSRDQWGAHIECKGVRKDVGFAG